MAEADFDLYDTLNVQRDASADDVRSAFRDLSRLYHPDKQAGVLSDPAASSGSRSRSGGSAGGEAAFMRVLHAYRVLSDDTMRQFYDRYGLSGVRLAENLTDDDGEAHVAEQLVLPEDKLKHLEGRVRRLMRKHEELRTRRLLGLQGAFVLSLASSPGPHGTHLRRRYRVHYTAISQSVQVCLGDNLRLTAGCTGHIQGASGFGASKLMLSAAGRIGALNNGRCQMNFVGPGSAVEGEANFSRNLSPHCSAHQKLSVAASGSCTLAVGFQCWLLEKLNGSMEVALGEQPGLTLDVMRRSTSARHKLRAFLRLQPGTGEIGFQAKLKPSKDFSLTMCPAISPKGWLLTLDCSKSMRDGLSKLHWVLRLSRNSVSLRLGLSRAGLRFAVPLELWPESAGPLPLPELCLAVALWALPPLVLRLAVTGGSVLLGRWGGGYKVGLASASSSSAPATAAAAAAEEQRQLLAPTALRRRQEEAARGGLEILCGRYGHPRHVADEATDCDFGMSPWQIEAILRKRRRPASAREKAAEQRERARVLTALSPGGGSEGSDADFGLGAADLEALKNPVPIRSMTESLDIGEDDDDFGLDVDDADFGLSSEQLRAFLRRRTSVNAGAGTASPLGTPREAEGAGHDEQLRVMRRKRASLATDLGMSDGQLQRVLSNKRVSIAPDLCMSGDKLQAVLQRRASVGRSAEHDGTSSVIRTDGFSDLELIHMMALVENVTADEAHAEGERISGQGAKKKAEAASSRKEALVLAERRAALEKAEGTSAKEGERARVLAERRIAFDKMDADATAAAGEERMQPADSYFLSPRAEDAACLSNDLTQQDDASAPGSDFGFSDQQISDMMRRRSNTNEESAPRPAAVDPPCVIDVTSCLMAWVRDSRLDLSEAPKSSLIGFYDPAFQGAPPSVLYVRYRFGDTVRARIFRNTEAVILP